MKKKLLFALLIAEVIALCIAVGSLVYIVIDHNKFMADFFDPNYEDAVVVDSSVCTSNDYESGTAAIEQLVISFSDKTDEEYIQAVYNWVAEEIDYEEGVKSGYTTIVTGQGDCVGQADLFRILLAERGVKCWVAVIRPEVSKAFLNEAPQDLIDQLMPLHAVDVYKFEDTIYVTDCEKRREPMPVDEAYIAYEYEYNYFSSTLDQIFRFYPKFPRFVDDLLSGIEIE